MLCRQIRYVPGCAMQEGKVWDVPEDIRLAHPACFVSVEVEQAEAEAERARKAVAEAAQVQALKESGLARSRLAIAEAIQRAQISLDLLRQQEEHIKRQIEPTEERIKALTKQLQELGGVQTPTEVAPSVPVPRIAPKEAPHRERAASRLQGVVV